MNITKKQKQILIYAAVAVAIGLLVYFIYFRNKKSDIFDQIKNKKAEEGKDSLENIKESEDFPLKKGSEGIWVKKLQKYLKDEHGAEFPEHGIDGIWGGETESQVQKYLKRDNVSKTLYLKKQIYKTEV